MKTYRGRGGKAPRTVRLDMITQFHSSAALLLGTEALPPHPCKKLQLTPS
jgi:hypothetical protein